MSGIGMSEYICEYSYMYVYIHTHKHNFWGGGELLQLNMRHYLPAPFFLVCDYFNGIQSKSELAPPILNISPCEDAFPQIACVGISIS